jgi:hypothetical protein
LRTSHEICIAESFCTAAGGARVICAVAGNALSGAASRAASIMRRI